MCLTFLLEIFLCQSFPRRDGAFVRNATWQCGPKTSETATVLAILGSGREAHIAHDAFPTGPVVSRGVGLVLKRVEDS